MANFYLKITEIIKQVRQAYRITSIQLQRASYHGYKKPSKLKELRHGLCILKNLA